MIRTKNLDSDKTLKQEFFHLESLSNLFLNLNEREIRYCHWKSNLRLDEALQGKTDLDLLVARKQSREFREILLKHHIKPVIAAPGRRYPALEDYLGFDESSGKLFHLHVHYQLLLGEQFVKNYRLPVEDKVLDSIVYSHGVKVPIPEVELIILCIRVLLKYRDRDFVKDLLIIRHPGIPGNIRLELESLIARTSFEAVNRVLTKDMEVLPRSTILDFISAFKNDPRNGREFFILRKKLREALKNFQRHSRWKATAIYIKEYWQRRDSFTPPKYLGKMTFANGGAAFALIGVDGAGKTTLHKELITWLRWKMDVKGYYLGSKQPSNISEILYVIFRLFRRTHRGYCKRFSKDSIFAQWLDNIKRNFLYAHYVSIGKDRFKRYQEATSMVNDGSIVVFDRFPLEQFSTQPDYRLLDGPQSQIVDEEPNGFLRKYLVSKEFDYYRKINLPDYLLVLDVDPEISIRRKPEHDEVVLSVKNRAVSDLLMRKGSSPHGKKLVRIDANRSFDKVLQQLKSVMWEAL